MNSLNPPLQPLRIPEGWCMSYNCGFYDIDPTTPNLLPVDCDQLFKEDMLQMTHERRNRLLDLGWYPEGDLENGNYRMELYEGDFTGTLLHSFSSNSRKKIVLEIESVLQDVSQASL